MSNIFEANIILCKQIDGENNPEGIFNNIEIEADESASFDIGIFFVADISERRNEMFILDIVHKEDKDSDTTQTNILGSLEKKYEEEGYARELIVLKENTVFFPWEGLYILELRHCEACVDINDKNPEEILESSEIVNTFTFSVEFKKK